MRVSYAVRHRDCLLVINTEDPAKITDCVRTLYDDYRLRNYCTQPCPDLRGFMDKVYVTLVVWSKDHARHSTRI